MEFRSQEKRKKDKRVGQVHISEGSGDLKGKECSKAVDCLCAGDLSTKGKWWKFYGWRKGMNELNYVEKWKQVEFKTIILHFLIPYKVEVVEFSALWLFNKILGDSASFPCRLIFIVWVLSCWTFPPFMDNLFMHIRSSNFQCSNSLSSFLSLFLSSL